MTNVIHQLPASVANMIAAGEVVQRPASIVKELVENSVDAGATEVKVIIQDAGRTLVQVIDNGCGMSGIDARLAFDKHATSKITSADDLLNLHTMGFRGEALASIAAVAQVELVTRREDEELGTRVVISGSHVECDEPTVASKGSQFFVRNLFFNIPARRNFLKSDATEMRYITSEFIHVALAHPDVAMSLVSNSQTLYNLSAGNMKNRVVAIAGKSMSGELLPVEVETDLITVKGFVGSIATARKSAGDQYFMVNNRYMRSSYFNKAIVEAYRGIIPSDQVPAYFIYLTIDPHKIDVNVHPQKIEIKFEDEASIWKILNAAVRDTLGRYNVMPALDFDASGQLDIPVRPNPGHTSNYSPFNPSNLGSYYNPFEREKEFESIDVSANNQPPCPAVKQVSFTASFQPSERQSVDGWQQLFSSKKEEEPRLFEGKPSAYFFQFRGRYIVTQVKSGLMFIDQHRAHERIQYDMLMSNVTSSQKSSQMLAFPEVMTIGAEDACVVEELSVELANVGLEYTYDAEAGLFSITAITSCFEASRVHSFIEALIYDYRNGEVDIERSIQQYVCTMVASQMALPTGKALTPEEMSSLYDRLFASSSPKISPRGKVIFTILTDDNIEQLFNN